MQIVDIEFQPGGLGLTFDDGSSTNANLTVISGVLYLTGLSAAHKAALTAFNAAIDVSVKNYDPRFGGGSGVGIFNVVEDLTPQLGGDLDLHGFRIYDATAPQNARGVKAMDLQLLRSAATQVASGDYSFIAGGRYNTASGAASYAEGSTTTASGAASHAEGDSTVASGITSHAEGYATNAIGIYSHAEGSAATASGGNSHAEGMNTVSSGLAAHAQGAFTVASGDCSFAAGYKTTASGHGSVAIGQSSVASLYCQKAHASGFFAIAGDAQRTETITRITTTDAAFHEMFLDGTGGSLTFSILSNKLYAITLTIAGRREGVAEGCMFVRMVVIGNDAGATTLDDQQTIGVDINPGGFYFIQLSADDVNDHLVVEVKYDNGGAVKTVRWVAILEAVEIAGS